ncbi:photoreceptor cilium actin regulator [Varanus komodoensis]|uniref:photoreceptor cilium actin regulator n=1 Tax=Varanus komodoensis TaxID=61221 RepID=UPI001CF78968|nr:photoreceptor cilium actin regulator [Varanus komodoensis]
MGCTPSRSDIAEQNANHGTKSLHKGILPINPGGEGFSLPLLIKSASSYDTEDFCRGETRIKDHSIENSSDDKNVNFHSSSEDPSLPELDLEEKEMEKAVSETEIAISELMETDKYVAEDITIKKQKPSALENHGFILEDKNDIQEKQNAKKGKKRNKQGKQGRHGKTKEKSSPSEHEGEKKVDFPDLLVKAHQNAYAYLNPNLSKYEVILCMANQATETQLIMQQMVSFLLLRFDEINHLLEEIAQDGEDLVKEVGENLAWPAGKGNPNEHPDLLQQLLQYTVNKMQLLNGTVASLTSDALQESCSFLQSAGNNLEEKLKAKQVFDERLLRMIKLLEISAVGPSHPHPDDMTLYSEDSGIGIDTESVKDLNLMDKQGLQANFASCSHVHSSLNQTRISGESQWPCTSVFSASRSHDCALERQFKDIFFPPAHTKDAMPSSQVVPENVNTLFQHQNIMETPSLNSVPCDVADENVECESSHASAYEDSDDNSLSEEDGDNISLSENDALPKRSASLPTATASKRRPSTKQTDSQENEEIILKMKDAISEKIKFVPAKSGKREWMEDENGKGPRRPSTATVSQKSQVKQKRSRSEESLKSHNEDPTLLELQRTQKGLSKRLEMFYTLKRNKEISNLASLSPKEPSNLQDSEHVTHRSSTNKLKASLSKNFSILPNQDKVPLCRHDQNGINKQFNEKKCKKTVITTTPSKDLASKKENDSPETQKLNSVGCTPPRKSVKKLIETFSSPESQLQPTSLRTLGPIKCIRKFGLPSITPSFSLPKRLVPLNHKHRILPLGDINYQNINRANSTIGSLALASGSDTNDDTDDDLENLPPPPPEMLMDILLDSAEPVEGARTGENSSEVTKNSTKRNENNSTKKISQRMKASLCSIDLLPSKKLSRPNVIANKASKTGGVDSIPRKSPIEMNSSHLSNHHQDIPLASPKDLEMDETAVLYKQSHKIIPLQNVKESDPGNKECTAAPALAQQQSSPDSLQKNEKRTGFVRRVSLVRTPPSSPPSEKRLSSPPLHHKHTNQASSPRTHWQPSPPANPKASNPPTQRKLPSPPTQQNLSSPPTTRKQASPISRKVPSPPTHHREASPSPFSVTPSPPTSPSRLHKGLQTHWDSGDEQQSPSPKIVSNVRSIFCPATSSLFEAKPVLPPNSSTAEAIMGHPELSAFVRRNSTQLRQNGDQQKRMGFSATGPQPFVRRSFSDRRPGFPLPLPSFAAAGSEPVLSQTR